ncbi:hypothetical protein JTB14_000256 [Gonioctena quinquepunctata]|nr:hypothetical protein JTB14_000256 [Gonioctena quinquepunctata]
MKLQDRGGGIFYRVMKFPIQLNSIQAMDNLAESERHQLADLTDLRNVTNKLVVRLWWSMRTTSPSIQQRHYALSPALQKHDLEKILRNDIIESSDNPWVSPIVLEVR